MNGGDPDRFTTVSGMIFASKEKGGSKFQLSPQRYSTCLGPRWLFQFDDVKNLHDVGTSGRFFPHKHPRCILGTS